MQVKILSEYGYNEALFGLGLSHGVTSDMIFDADDEDPILSFLLDAPTRTRMEGVANKLAGKGNGHDKFLRMIQVWIDVEASLTWWKQFDTYKVGTTVQSSSTMHTLMKTPITQSMFENTIPETWVNELEQLRKDGYQDTLYDYLPNSFLQRRIVNCNYAVLTNIINQRKGHKLGAWAVFIDDIRSQCEHPELLP